MSTVKNSHYISHFSLRNWVHPKTGKVTVFNFSSGGFETKRPRDLYVANVAFPPDVERWLSSTIESPLGEYVARVKRVKRDPGKPLRLPEATEREWKAIALWVLTQPGRTALAQDPSDTHLIELVRKGDAFIDDLVRANHNIAHVSVVFAARERLYLPDGGIVAMPFLGGFGMFVPLDPCLLAAVVPRTAMEGVDAILHREGVVSALSAGLKGDRIVIPPMQDGVDLNLVAALLWQARSSAEGLARVFLAQNKSLGIELTDAWRPPRVVAPEAVEEADDGGEGDDE
jgi:hypothetical protein